MKIKYTVIRNNQFEEGQVLNDVFHENVQRIVLMSNTFETCVKFSSLILSKELLADGKTMQVHTKNSVYRLEMTEENHD